MDFLTPDKVVGTYDLRSDVKNTSTIPPGYVPPLIRGLSLEDSVQSTSWSTSKHKPHTLYLGINQGYNDTSSLDSIFSQSNTLNQNVITTKTTKTISNDKSSHRNKSSTVPNVMKIVRKSYDTLDVGRNRYEKHLKADPELIAVRFLYLSVAFFLIFFFYVTVLQQITLIELEYFQAIEADEFYTLKWNSKEKLQYAPNIVASTRWFNQIIFWVQKHILNEKSLSKRTEILSHFIRMAKKLVDFNNFSSGMAIISALNMQCIHRLNATWSHLTSRDRHIFRKLADLFSQEENFINLRTAVDHSRLPCIPYLGIYLSDLTFIDVAASSLNNRRENSTWTNQGKQDRINNILRIIANFQQSNYPFVRNESIASYLETQRYIEELQRFIEDANYKLSIQLEPPPTSSPPDLSRQNSSYTVPPNYSFLSSINSSNDNILKPVPIYTCTANVTSKCDTVTTTTTPLSPIKTTTSSSSPLSCKTPTMNNKTTRIRHPNKGNTEHMISHSTVNQQIKSNPTLCDLLGPPMIPPPPRVKQTYSQEDISISSSNHNPVVNSVQRPRKKPTHQKLGSWGGFGLLFSDNDATPTIDKTDNKQNSSTSTTSTTTNTGSSSHLLPRSPHFKRNVKLSVNNPESTKNSLSNQNHGFAKRSSPTILKRYMNTNNDNNNNSNTKTSNQPNGDLYFMFDDRPSSNSSRSSPHLLVFTDCLNKPDNNHKQSIKKEQMISGNSMPIYSSSSSNNSVIELQCIKQSKSTHSRNQSSIFPDDISNAKTVPGTPCRRIKQHHNYTNMGMSNLEQKRSTNLTTTDDDDHHHNSTSSKHISSTNTSFKDLNNRHDQRKTDLSHCHSPNNRKMTTKL
uniref:Ras-GEF domain-containing protein n=2 Tax=Schistosoma mansoni TaxID=6183 RepID=A0A5K4F3Y4_SCHMA